MAHLIPLRVAGFQSDGTANATLRRRLGIVKPDQDTSTVAGNATNSSAARLAPIDLRRAVRCAVVEELEVPRRPPRIR
jgi:hypothetical protein